MKKDDKAEKRRSHRAMMKERERLSREEREDELSIKEVESETPEASPNDDITKGYGYAEPAYSAGYGYAPATSWEEVDALEAEREAFEKVAEVGGTVQSLVSNIVYDPDMDVTQKAEAIKAVADGFAERCVEGMDEEDDGEEMDKDLDMLAIKSVQAHDHRTSSLFGNVGDVVKAVLTAKRENALSDSQFGLVTERGGKKVRKYPIHDKAHVRNALSRAAQMIKRGGEAASDAKAALPKIHAAAKRMGIGMSKERDPNAMTIEKDLNGDWRWIGWVSNNFKDLDGDIITESAHKEYVEWLDKNMDVAPVSVTWHTPGTARTYPVDFAAYESGFLIMSGKLTEKEAEGLLRASTETDLGMSHGAFAFERDPKDLRCITKYRTFEVSDLPLTNAANPFTTFSTITKEVDMDKLQYLSAILGEEKAKAFLEKTGMKQKELQEAGVESKEVETPVVETVVETPAVATTPAPAVDQDAIVSDVLKAIDADGLGAFVKETNEKIILLETLVKELSVSKEEKLAELISPPAEKAFAWSKARASQDEATVVKETDEISSAAPKINWLNEATGTTPLQS